MLGVLYAEDFDAPVERRGATPPPEPEAPEPVFTAADMEAARAEGRAAGLAEAERGLTASRVHMLGLVADGLRGATEGCQTVAEDAADAMARLMLGILNACLPATCAAHGAVELQAVARALLPSLRAEPRVAVRVHPLMIPTMQAEVAALDPELAEQIVLLPTEQIPPGDARITWREGTATRDTGRARASVQEALAVLGLLEKEITDA